MKQSIGSGRGSVYVIILKALQTGDKYGYEICKEIEDKSDGKYILKQPSLYSGLKRLEAQKLVSSYWKESDFASKRHYYTLTPEGRKKIENTDFSWEDFRDEFMCGLFEKKIESGSVQTSFLPMYNNEAVSHDDGSKQPEQPKSKKLNFHVVSPLQQDIFSLVSQVEFTNDAENGNANNDNITQEPSNETVNDNLNDNPQTTTIVNEDNVEEPIQFLDSTNASYSTSSLNDILSGKKYSGIEESLEDSQNKIKNNDENNSILDYNKFIEGLENDNLKSYSSKEEEPSNIKSFFGNTNTESVETFNLNNFDKFKEDEVEPENTIEIENEQEQSTSYNIYQNSKIYESSSENKVLTNTQQNSFVSNINTSLEPPKKEIVEDVYQNYNNYSNFDDNNQYYQQEDYYNNYVASSRRKHNFECDYEIRYYNKNEAIYNKQKTKYIAINKLNFALSLITTLVMLGLELIVACFIDKKAFASPEFMQYFCYIVLALVAIAISVFGYLRMKNDPDKRFSLNYNFSQMLFIDICTSVVLLLLIFSCNYFLGMRLDSIISYATTFFLPAIISVVLMFRPLFRKILEKFNYFYQ